MSKFLEPLPSLMERYRQDPQFKAIVDQMYALMIQAQVTPYELRDAAYIASIKFAEMHVEPLHMSMRFPETHTQGR